VCYVSWGSVPCVAADVANKEPPYAYSVARTKPAYVSTPPDLTMRSTVAIVDDDFAIAQALTGLLDMLGYHCVHFGSAEDFLQDSRDRAVDCLILDLVLPGMNGLDLQKTLTDLGDNIPIIFLSSHGAPNLREMVMNRGAVEFLQKPCDIEEIARTLQHAITTRGC
jgi:FixJ family two-component response regulator